MPPATPPLRDSALPPRSGPAWPRSRMLSVLLLAAATLLASPAWAGEDGAPPEAAVPPDLVHLRNGDRLSGTVKTLAGGELTLDTAWGGEVRIPWEAVARLETAEPVHVVLEDGTALRGALSSPEPGRLRVATPELTPDPRLELAVVTSLNPAREPAVVLEGGASLAVVSARGNTESQSVSLLGELTARTAASRYTLGLESYEASEDDRDTASRSTAHLGYDHFLSERWYLNTNARFTEDEFRGLELRSSFGLGGGYQFWEREEAALSLELGLSHVDENFLTAADGSFSAGRWNLDLRQRLGPSVSFFHTQDGLWSLEDSEDLLIQTRTGLRFSLVGSLVASAQLSFDWNDSPAPGREEGDRTWLLSLGYEW